MLTRLAVAWPRFCLLLAALLSLLSLAVAAFVLEINTDENDLFAADLQFVERRSEYYQSLPVLADPIVVALESATNSGASHNDLNQLAFKLAGKLIDRKDVFTDVIGVAEPDFTDSAGLLYMDTEDRYDTLDDIVEAQPLLGTLSRDPSLGGLLALLNGLLEPSTTGENRSQLIQQTTPFLGRFADTLQVWIDKQPGQLNWSALFDKDATKDDIRRAIFFALPVVDYASTDPAADAIKSLHSIARELPEISSGAVRLRLTGVPVLAHEDGKYIGPQAGITGAFSAILVVLVLSIALGNRRMLGALVLTLVTALCLTAGAATFIVGHLNLISIAFGVLCIGLGVDFGIHYSLRCKDISRGDTNDGASTVSTLRATAIELKRPLILCAITSSVAFIAFVPTGFVGMAELGLITACGLLASLLATFTVLPAALAWLLPERIPRTQLRCLPLESVDRLIAGREKLVLICVVVLGLLALIPASRIHFDADPLGVRDPKADSVKLLRELLKDDNASPLAMNVLVDDAAAAEALAERLREIPLVGTVTTAADLLPEDQANAIEDIEDTAFAILPTLKIMPARLYPEDELLERFRTLHLQVIRAATEFPDNTSLQRLQEALATTLRGDNREYADLEQRLFTTFPSTIKRLTALLQPEPVSIESLPPTLQKMILDVSGKHRIEINPDTTSGIDGSDVKRVGEFVDAVLEVAPDAYGEGYAIREISEVVLRAFAFAFAIAAIAILAISYLSLRDVRRTLAVVLPLVFACLFTVAICVMLGIALNFANVIVLPLLLGIGIDTAIHLVHRANSPSDDMEGSDNTDNANDLHRDRRLLHSSAASAAFYSGLTTLVSFGTMAFARHQGLASLGSMLWIGVLVVLLVNFILIPALLGLNTQEADRRNT